MSGGHWNYLSRRLEERIKSSGEVWRLLAVLEHELDWGICCDTCECCARIRVAKALEAFFDTECQDATLAISVAKDQSQYKCIKCGGEL